MGTGPLSLVERLVAAGILPVGVVMCDQPASRIFGPLRCFTLTRKASKMSNSGTIVLGL